MTTEAASAPVVAPVVAPADSGSVATVPGTDLPAHPDAPGKIDLKAFFEDRYKTQHAVKRGTAATPAPAAAPKAAPAAIPAPAAAVETETAKDAPAPAIAAEEPAKAEQDEIDKRLARLLAASDSAARERKMREREQAAERKVKEATTAHADDIALARKLTEARTKGSKLAVLEAAGYTREDITNSGFVVDLLNELGEQEAPAPLTAADVDRMLAERIKADEDARKAAADKAKAEADAQLAEAKGVFFSQVKVEFKAGGYPALRADGVTQGALDAFYQSHLARNPGQFWTAKELLDRAESHTVAFYDEQEKKIAGIKAKLKPAAPAPKTHSAGPARTVTPSSTADAGPVVIETPKKLDVREKQRLAREQFVAKFAARAR